LIVDAVDRHASWRYAAHAATPPAERERLRAIASNLLAERIRELEVAGVITREEAPAPIATVLFSLTSREEQLQPVLEGLIRWRAPLIAEREPDDAARSRWLAAASELMCSRAADPTRPPVTLRLHTVNVASAPSAWPRRVRTVPPRDSIAMGSSSRADAFGELKPE
jgi:HxlR-like helix-turn-helix